MTDDLWEPWQPTVGQRGRVRISAECRTPNKVRHAHTYQLLGRRFGHRSEVDGATGVVDEVYDPEGIDAESRSHRFHVRLDTKILIPKVGYFVGIALAAAELEPAD